MHIMVIDDNYASWRHAALEALRADVLPELIEWHVATRGDVLDGQALFDYGDTTRPGSAGPAAAPTPVPTVTISRELAAQLQDAALFRTPQRWAFLYKVLWRWQQGDRAVASPADPDGGRLQQMAKTVRREKHDMIAYVRFRKQEPQPGAPEYAAWYEPAHDVLAWAADHFAARMGRSSWLIATPHGAALWNGRELQLQQRHALQSDHLSTTPDEAEALWLIYYKSTFNPARLNESALQQHMPVRFWKGLTEGHLIPGMISEARNGAQRIAQTGSVGALGGKSIPIEAQQAQPVRHQPSSLDACRRCDLWRHATQAVGGTGPHDARIMLIGEQPGDQEDLGGRAFIGPAGQLLDAAMERAGLPRAEVYMTNAVKHFKWTLRGKRRLHKTPGQREVESCSYWLEQELQSVRPKVVVTLGATALGALLREKVSLQDHLAAPFEMDGTWIVATYHPSFALRQLDSAAQTRVVDTITAALINAMQLNGSLDADFAMHT